MLDLSVVEKPPFFSRGRQLAFTEADSKIDQLEALLLKHGITVPCGSKLEEIFLSTKKYLALNKREMSLPPTTDLRDEWVRMLGLVDFAFKIIGASETKWFGCGSFRTWLDESSSDHLTSRSCGGLRGSGLGTAPSA